MRRVLLLSLSVAALVMSSACSLTGYAGNSNDPKYEPKFEGKHRVLAASQLGFISTGPHGNNVVTSYVHAMDFKDYDADEIAHHEANKTTIRAYQTVLDYGNGFGVGNDHGGFDSGYRAENIVEAREVIGSKKHPGNVKLTHETRDTNKDGWISGDDAECGLASGLGFLGGAGTAPIGAYFKDKSTCVGANAAGNSVGAFTSGITDFTGDGVHVTFKENDAEEKAYENSAFDKLPFSARVDLMNSVSSTDIRSEGGQEVVKVALTAIRIGDQTYSPDGVTADLLIHNGNARLDNSTSGMRVTAAFIADRARAQLAAGVTDARQIDGSVTINGSVTLTLAQVLGAITKNGVTTPMATQAVIDAMTKTANGASSPSDHL